MPRFVHPAVQAYRESGRPMVERHLVWVTPRAGDPIPHGFWTGSNDQALQVYSPETGGIISRTYHAAGSLITVAGQLQPTGLEIHPWEISLSIINEAVDAAVRSLDLRRAAIELHRMWFDYDSRQPLAPAHVWNTGTIQTAKIVTPAASTGGDGGGDGGAEFRVTVAPMTRALSIGQPELLSDEIQRQRGGDRILRYIGGQGTRELKFGGK